MFPKRNRITKAEFQKVFKLGKRLFSPYFTIIYYTNQDVSTPQFSVVVGSKIDKRATQRNKIKRKVREVLLKSMKNIPPHIQCIFLCKPLISSLSVVEIEQEVLKYIQRMR